MTLWVLLGVRRVIKPSKVPSNESEQGQSHSATLLQITRSGSRLSGVLANVFTICHNKRTVTSLSEICRQQNQPQLQAVEIHCHQKHLE